MSILNLYVFYLTRTDTVGRRINVVVEQNLFDLFVRLKLRAEQMEFANELKVGQRLGEAKTVQSSRFKQMRTTKLN